MGRVAPSLAPPRPYSRICRPSNWKWFHPPSQTEGQIMKGRTGNWGEKRNAKKVEGITELHVHGDERWSSPEVTSNTYFCGRFVVASRERERERGVGGGGGGHALEDGEGGRGGDQYWAQEVKAYTGNRARERLRTFSFPERSPSSLSLASFCSWDGCYSSPPPVRQACQTRSQTNSSDSACEASLVYHSVHHQKAIGSFSTVKCSSGPECC